LKIGVDLASCRKSCASEAEGEDGIKVALRGKSRVPETRGGKVE